MSFEQIAALTPCCSCESRWDRRGWLASLAASVACTGILTSAKAPAVLGMQPEGSGSQFPTFRIRSVLELQGEVHLMSQGSGPERRNGKQVIAKKPPVQSTTTLDYDEQYVIHGKQDDRCVQYFHEAKAEINVDGHVTETELREPCREIVKRAALSGIQSASPTQPLFAAERDLVEGSLTTMYIDELLTEKEVSIGDKWNIDSVVIAKLLNLDAVHDGKLTVCLVDTDKEKANLAIEGRLTGSVRNVNTEMVIEGKAVLDRSGGYVSWLALKTEETREVSEAEPGFKVTANLRVLRAPVEQMSHGRTLDVAFQEIENWESTGILQFQSDHGFYRFLADRRWTTYRDNGEEATLRFIVGNRRVAQCNITNLIDYEPGRQLSLEGFQVDVGQLISKGKHEMLEASERVSSTKHRLLKITVGGVVEGVPVRWLYYHVSNDSGRRLTMTFVMDEASLETFGEQDQQLAGTIELLAWPSKTGSEQANQEKERTKGESAAAEPKTSKR